MEHQDEIAPDPNDPLHEVLDELGEIPEASVLVGKFALMHDSGPIIFPCNINLDDVLRSKMSKFSVPLTSSMRYYLVCNEINII